MSGTLESDVLHIDLVLLDETGTSSSAESFELTLVDIRHLVTIDAPADVVYRAVIQQEGLSGWWTEEALAEAKVGGVLEFKFGDEYHNKMRITQLVPDKRVEWECCEGDD